MDKGQSMHGFVNHGNEFGFYSKYNETRSGVQGGMAIDLLSHKMEPGASLVAQWLRICLLMQETRVRALVWEDPTCHGAAGPVSHSC